MVGIPGVKSVGWKKAFPSSSFLEGKGGGDREKERPWGAKVAREQRGILIAQKSIRLNARRGKLNVDFRLCSVSVRSEEKAAQ